MNKYLHVLSTLLVRFWWNLVQHICSWCCWALMNLMKFGQARL